MHPVDLEQLPPAITASVSEDEDVVVRNDPYYATNSTADELLYPKHRTLLPSTEVLAPPRNEQEDAVAFLLRYESMLQKQEAEQIATLDHVQRCLERLEQFIPIVHNHNHNTATRAAPSSSSSLQQQQQQQQNNNKNRFLTTIMDGINSSSGNRDANNDTDTTTDDPRTLACCWQRRVRFCDLRQALQRLEQQVAGCSPREWFTTDRQLMMVLRTILDGNNRIKVHHHSSSSTTTSKEEPQRHYANDENSNSNMLQEEDITWAELAQCYKTCIVGMQTLQLLPPAGPSSAARDRSRNRTLAMISLFGMDTMQYSASSPSSVLTSTNHDEQPFTTTMTKQKSVETNRSSSSSVSSKRMEEKIEKEKTKFLWNGGVTATHESNVVSFLFLLFVIVLTSFCSLCLQEYVRTFKPSDAAAAIFTNDHPFSTEIRNTASPSIMPQQQPPSCTTWSTATPLSHVTMSSGATSGRAAAATVNESGTPTPSVASNNSLDSTATTTAAARQPGKDDRGLAANAHGATSHLVSPVLGAVIAGPIAAACSRAWQLHAGAGSLISSSILPSMVFGIGIYSLASVALHALRKVACQWKKDKQRRH